MKHDAKLSNLAEWMNSEYTPPNEAFWMSYKLSSKSAIDEIGTDSSDAINCNNKDS